MTSYTFSQLIDFGRTSSATYVNASGYVTTTPMSANLLTSTQEFSSWTNTNTTVTSNTIASPDGISTADTITDNTVSDRHLRSITGLNAYTSTGVTYTASVYVKKSTHSYVLLDVYGGTSGYYFSAVYNLDTATVSETKNGTSGGTVSGSSITAVGTDGWYRITLTGSIASTAAPSSFFVGFAPAASGNTFGTTGGISYVGTGTSFYAWGAQFEASASATNYTRNYSGLYPPRFDYDPVTLTAKGFLVEPQSTNLLTYSSQLDNAAWSKTATITADNLTSPDGTTNADLVSTTGNYQYVRQSITATANAAYTVSFYVKPVSGSTIVRVQLTNAAQTEVAGSNFDLTGAGSLGTLFQVGTGVVTSRTVTQLSNGWYRCTVSGTVNTTTLYGYIDNHSNGTMSFGVWGAQLEALAYPTSYIPTTSATVTRTADNATIQTPVFGSFYNSSAGTIVVEFDSGATSATTPAPYHISDGSSNNRVLATVNSAGTGISTIITTAAATQFSATNTISYTQGTVYKTGVAFTTNDAVSSASGAVSAQDTSVTMPTVTSLRLGASVFNTNYLAGHLRSVRYYNTRLTDAQLQALTS